MDVNESRSFGTSMEVPGAIAHHFQSPIPFHPSFAASGPAPSSRLLSVGIVVVEHRVVVDEIVMGHNWTRGKCRMVEIGK